MPKDDVYEYEGESYVLTGEYFNDYLTKTGVELDKLYTTDESTHLMNTHTIGCYQGIFTCGKPLTGKEICDTLSDIQEELFIRIDSTCKEEESK